MEDGTAEELLRLETALARRRPDGVDGGLGALIAEDFLEHGASGATWDATSIRAILAKPPDDTVELAGFRAAALAPDVVLVTYRVVAPRRSNRASIWVRRDGRWQMRFHQGTSLDAPV